MDSILSVNPGLIFWTIVSFLLLLFLLGKMAWGPIVASLDRREKAIRDAEARANAIFQEAQSKADAQIDRARREIGLEEERAVAAVRQQAVDLSIEAASRLLGRTLNTDDNRRLVEQFLKEIEKKETT